MASTGTTRNREAGVLRKNEIILNVAQYRRGLALFDPGVSDTHWPALVFDRLLQEVMNTGFQALWRGKEISFSTRFRLYFQRKWFTELIPNLLREILVLGVAAVRFVKDKETDYLVPHALSDGLGMLYNITIQTNIDGTRFRAYKLPDINEGRRPSEMKHVVVFSGFGYDPMADGTLRSVCAGLHDIHTDFRENLQLRRSTEMTNAHPPLLLEREQKDVPSDSFPQNESGRVPLLDLYDLQPDGRAGERFLERELNADEIDLVRAHEENYYSLSEADYQKLFLSVKSRQTGLRVPEHSLFPLPIGHKARNPPLPTRQPDWTSTVDAYQQEVALSFGLSHEFVTGRGQIQMAAGGALIQRHALSTIAQWKIRFSRMLTDLWGRVYLVDDIVTALEQYDRTTEFKGTPIAEMRERFQGPHVNIVLPIIPNEPFDILTDKYLLGLIDWNSFRQNSRVLSGYLVDYTDECSSEDGSGGGCEDPWSDPADRVALLAQRNPSLAKRLGETLAVRKDKRGADPDINVQQNGTEDDDVDVDGVAEESSVASENSKHAPAGDSVAKESHSRPKKKRKKARGGET